MPAVSKVRRGKATAAKASKNTLLPTKTNTPPNSLWDSVILIYGRKAIGKTSLANTAPDALTFMCERFRRNLEIFQVPQQGQGQMNWQKLLDYQEAFLESDQFQTAILDTVDRVYLMCMEAVCKQCGVSHPSEGDYGGVWDEVKITFDAYISTFVESGKGLIMLSHETARSVNIPRKGLARANTDDAINMEQKRMEPSLRPQGIGVVQEMADYVLYYCFIDEVRGIYVRSPNEVAWTACGTDKFVDPDGTLLNRFHVGNDPDEAAKNLIRAYNGELRDVDYEPPRQKKNFRKKS